MLIKSKRGLENGFEKRRKDTQRIRQQVAVKFMHGSCAYYIYNVLTIYIKYKMTNILRYL